MAFNGDYRHGCGKRVQESERQGEEAVGTVPNMVVVGEIYNRTTIRPRWTGAVRPGGHYYSFKGGYPVQNVYEVEYKYHADRRMQLIDSGNPDFMSRIYWL